MCCKKYLKDNKHNSLHLRQKYAWIFVCRSHLFFKACYTVFYMLYYRENCSLLRTDILMPADKYFCAKGSYCFIVLKSGQH